MIFHIV